MCSHFRSVGGSIRDRRELEGEEIGFRNGEELGGVLVWYGKKEERREVRSPPSRIETNESRERERTV